MKKTILFSLFLGFTLCGKCQEMCGFYIEYDHPLIESEAQMGSGGFLDILTIPTVVHVIHIGEPIGEGTNISNEQIESAFVAANQDFRKEMGTNGDGEGVDTEIELCLSQVNRVDGSIIPEYLEEGIAAGSTVLGGANEVEVKDLSRADRDLFLNIWIVTEIRDNNGGSGVQGYAYFPNSSASRDGIVILHNAFGTVGNLKSYTALNRVLTHELGHYAFLYHIFEGGSCTEDDCTTDGDKVCDTYPSTQFTSCINLPCDGMAEWENYLAYTSQSCMSEFTQGQKDRMRDALTMLRPTVLEQPCEGVSECLGDINGDGLVGIEDFIALNSAFGSFCGDCSEDLNGDGIVDTQDFLLLNSNYGNVCGELAPSNDPMKVDILGRKR